MILKTNNGTHGFANRVESVDLVQSVFRNFASYGVIVFTEIENKAKQSTFRLVANLLRWTAALVCRLRMSYIQFHLLNNNN